MSDSTIDAAGQAEAQCELIPAEGAVVTETETPVVLTSAEQAAALRCLFADAKTKAADLEAQMQAQMADTVATLRAKVAEVEASGLTVEHGLDATDASADKFSVAVFEMVKTEV